MQPAERNYNVHDKELLSVIRVFETWCPYLEGNPFLVEVVSDYQNLEYFITACDLNRQRWSFPKSVHVCHSPPARLIEGWSRWVVALTKL